MEGDLLSAFRWASSQTKALLMLVSVCDIVLNIARDLQVCFGYVRHNANLEAIHLAKEGMHHHGLILNFDSTPVLFVFCFCALLCVILL